jgi:hypothetical protein
MVLNPNRNIIAILNYIFNFINQKNAKVDYIKLPKVKVKLIIYNKRKYFFVKRLCFNSTIISNLADLLEPWTIYVLREAVLYFNHNKGISGVSIYFMNNIKICN